MRREHRVCVTDDGAAIGQAGRPPRWRAAADRIDRELGVNVSQHGVISLPVVPVGEASLGLYQELLELEE